MARPYRKVAQATEDIRRCLGALSGVDTSNPSTAFFAVGYVANCLERVLADLQADRIVEPSEAFADGYDAMAAAMQPLPFPEA